MRERERGEPAEISTAVGDYLKAIWTLAGSGSASTGHLAERLNVSAPSVSRMLSRLKKMDLVRHERYSGARLTEEGLHEALRLVRRHRLLETFLILHLGYSWDEVHDEAEVMEHAMSDRFTERLAGLLRHPAVDPHGDPIPRADGTLPKTPDLPLTETSVGDRFRICRLCTQDSERLSYFAELQLVPGQQLTVLQREPFGDLMVIEVEGRQLALSRELAQLVAGESTDA